MARIEEMVIHVAVFVFRHLRSALAALRRGGADSAHITIAATTVFLHRHQAHRALHLHPAANHFFHLWLRLITGMGYTSAGEYASPTGNSNHPEKPTKGVCSMKRKRTMNDLQKYLSTCLLVTAALLGGTSLARAQAPLGVASGFAVLGGTNVTCTAGSVIGDVGVSPGSAVPFTNTGCTIAGGTPPATDPAAAQARTDFLSAYAALQLQSTSCTSISGTLAGGDLAPGVYCVDTVAKTGLLTLTGPSDGVWIFLVNGALTGTDFSVVMAGGGQPCNVFWAPSGAATMTTSALKGNILAGDAAIGSITLTGGTLAGRALANVAVTMTGASVIGCDALSGSPSCKGKKHHGYDKDKEHRKCNQGVGNGSEGCDPGHSDQHNPLGSNDEDGGTPANPGRKGGDK